MAPRRTLSLLLLALLAAAPLRGQIPDAFQNLQVLPEDIGRDSLIFIMRSISFATGYRCEGCHVMGEGGSFQGAQFHLDDKEIKLKARYMIRMTERINSELLTGLPHRDQPPLLVECKTCHRGIEKPFLLRTELRRIIADDGIQAAVARYRELREGAMHWGTYDFGEWEMNELARQLAADDMPEAAVVMLELNEEFHPRSSSIPMELGELHERLGNREAAIAAYHRVLGRAPGNRTAQARLEALTGR